MADNNVLLTGADRDAYIAERFPSKPQETKPAETELILFTDGPQQACFDLDQCRDIATHGMAQGVSGFIYSHNLWEWFNENTDEIESYLNEWIDNCCDGNVNSYIQYLGSKCEDHLQLKADAVWLYVEQKCNDFLIQNDPNY